MSDSLTTVLEMTKPEVGASDDTWGDKINDNLDLLDALFADTGEGTIVRRNANDDGQAAGFAVSKAAGNARKIKFQSGTSVRWVINADATAEAGADAGSLLKFDRYSDAAAYLGTALSINRATGKATFETTPEVGANDVYHEGNTGLFVTPVGVVLPFAGTTAPDNFLFCYGQLVSRTTYAALYAALGDTYGAGNGATTFNLPDLRGRVVAGQDDMGGTSANRLTGLTAGLDGDTLGATGGAETHVLTQAQLPAATLATTIAAGQGSHTHVETGSSGNSSDLRVVVGNTSATPQTSLSSTAAATLPAMAGTTPTGGTDTPHNNVQPTIALNYIIRAL